MGGIRRRPATEIAVRRIEIRTPPRAAARADADRRHWRHRGAGRGATRQPPGVWVGTPRFLDSRLAEQSSPLPPLGEPAQLSDVVTQYRIQRVIVWFRTTRDDDLGVAAASRPPGACRRLRVARLGEQVSMSSRGQHFEI
jgi:hypothetical protein